MEMRLALVPWFLWSIVYPGGNYYDRDIHAAVIKEVPTRAACEALKAAYQDAIHYEARSGQQDVIGFVRLICSPVNPKP